MQHVRAELQRLAEELPEIRGVVVPLTKSAAKWEKLPKGWTNDSVSKFWDTLTGDNKHKVTKCIKEMSKGDKNIDDPGAFCASLADKVMGPEWRKKKASRTRKMEKAVRDQIVAINREIKSGRKTNVKKSSAQRVAERHLIAGTREQTVTKMLRSLAPYFEGAPKSSLKDGVWDSNAEKLMFENYEKEMRNGLAEDITSEVFSLSYYFGWNGPQGEIVGEPKISDWDVDSLPAEITYTAKYSLPIQQMMSELAWWLENHAIDSRMQRPFEAHLKKLFRDSKFLKLAATLIHDDVKFDVRNRNFPFQTIQEKDGKNKDALEGVIEEAAAEEDRTVDLRHTLIGHDYSKLEKSWFKLSGSQIDFFFVVVSDVEGDYIVEEPESTMTRAQRRRWEYENSYYASVKRVAARFDSEGKAAAYPNKDSKEGLNANKAHERLLDSAFKAALSQELLAYDIAREHDADRDGRFNPKKDADRTITNICSRMLKSSEQKSAVKVVEKAYQLSLAEGWHNKSYEDDYQKLVDSQKRLRRFASSFDFDAGHMRIVLQRASASRSSCIVRIAAKHPVFQHNGVWFEDAAQAIDSVGRKVQYTVKEIAKYIDGTVRSAKASAPHDEYGNDKGLNGSASIKWDGSGEARYNHQSNEITHQQYLEIKGCVDADLFASHLKDVARIYGASVR